MFPGRRTGFTLVEMVVYCGLLSIFAALFLVSLPSRENASLENLSYSAEQSGLVLSKIHRDVCNSSALLASMIEGGEGMALPSALDAANEEYSYDNQGEMLWRSWVAYKSHERALNRFEYPFKRAVSRSGVEPFEELSRLSQGGVRLMASDVAEFQVERVKETFKVTLTIDVQGERVRNVTSMAPRN